MMNIVLRSKRFLTTPQTQTALSSQYRFILQVQHQEFHSIFGNIFKRNKPEESQPEDQKKTDQKKETEEAAEAKQPTQYHKETVQRRAKDKHGEKEDIKQKIRTLDREGEDNLFGRYKRVRKTVKERNENLEQHLHEDL